MLTLINGGKVVSDEGFEIELHVHRREGYVTYHEATRGLLIHVNCFVVPGAGAYEPYELEVPEQLKWNHPWNQPQAGQILAEAEKTQVINRIRDAFDLMRTPTLVRKVKE